MLQQNMAVTNYSTGLRQVEKYRIILYEFLQPEILNARAHMSNFVIHWPSSSSKVFH